MDSRLAMLTKVRYTQVSALNINWKSTDCLSGLRSRAEHMSALLTQWPYLWRDQKHENIQEIKLENNFTKIVHKQSGTECHHDSCLLDSILMALDDILLAFLMVDWVFQEHPDTLREQFETVGKYREDQLNLKLT